MKTIHKTGEQSADNVFTFVMSSSHVDRVGDTIDPAGIDLKSFQKNPIALWAHNHAAPIGTWANVRVQGKKLLGDLKLAAKGTSRLVDELHSLIEQRIIKTVSVGFSPLKWRENEHGGYDFIESELLECSLCSVPANAHALRIKGLDITEKPRCSGGDGLPSAKRTTKAAPQTKTPAGATSQTGNRPMKIADKILQKRARLAEVSNLLADIQKDIEDAEDDVGITDEQQEQIDLLTDEKAAVTSELERLERLEKAAAGRAAPVGDSPSAGAPQRRVATSQPGPRAVDDTKFLLARVAMAHAIAHFEKRNVQDVLKTHFKDDHEVAAIVKTAAQTADTTTAGWAAELVTMGTAAFLEEIRALSVFGALQSAGPSIPFGNDNSVSMPYRAGRGQARANWVGERGHIPVESLQFASKTFSAHKAAGIVPVSNELIRRSRYDVLQIIQDGLLEDFSAGIDSSVLDASAAVAGVRPAGILNGVTPVAATGTTTDEIIADINAAVAPLEAARNTRNLYMITNPARVRGLSTRTNALGQYMFRDEVNAGMPFGMGLINSDNAATDKVIILDAACFGSAYGSPEFDIDSSTVLVMANADTTAPTHATDGAGAIGTEGQVKPAGGLSVTGGEDAAGAAAGAGKQAISMFQTYSTAIRLVIPLSFGMLRDDAVSVIDGAAW